MCIYSRPRNSTDLCMVTLKELYLTDFGGGGIDYYQELITNDRKECWRAKTPSKSSHQKAVPTSWDP